MQDFIINVLIVIMVIIGGLSSLYVVIAFPAVLIWKAFYCLKHKNKKEIES